MIKSSKRTIETVELEHGEYQIEVTIEGDGDGVPEQIRVSSGQHGQEGYPVQMSLQSQDHNPILLDTVFIERLAKLCEERRKAARPYDHQFLCIEHGLVDGYGMCSVCHPRPKPDAAPVADAEDDQPL